MNKTFIKALLLIAVLGVSQICLGETPEPAVTQQVAETADKTELISSIIKFGTVMFFVMLSSVVIFVGLSIWNAILARSRSKNVDYDVTLKSPQSVDEAVMLFIHKNRLK